MLYIIFMENPIAPNPILTPVPSSHKYWVGIIFAFLSFVLLTFVVFLYYQNIQLKQRVNIPIVKTVLTPTPSVSDKAIIWNVAKHGGLFSYEYPAGWHVAELWQENYAQNGIMIAFDPNPINTAPRGGPIATFQITLLNGNKNPDEILQQKMASFNATNYSNITKEVMNAPIGTVYHYKGIVVGPMAAGETMEEYFFTFHKTSNDPSNQQIVIATLALNNDPKLSDMLRHIVLSFKELPL